MSNKGAWIVDWTKKRKTRSPCFTGTVYAVYHTVKKSKHFYGWLNRSSTKELIKEKEDKNERVLQIRKAKK